ncbi:MULTISPECIES: acyl carrier protein [Paenibacillus]|uniref:Acyl carrier protein n=2 Tax=Paenibacillus TaxID=44249 RepID=A0A559IPE5_9BACL|nr:MULTISPECIES: phosphopantetheine-binding protein [Paenibacillus]MBD8498177.1 acyl carrier protein [Paenibacillus arenosi]MCR8844726.1 phosphopantetheine-binding protein [Paenibacillus sp. SC116]TVX89521.1 acyl carrier protein [Paenibacillus agilis]
MNTYEAGFAQAAERMALTSKIKEIIVQRLDMDIDPAFITDDQPIFGRGLGLDSIDALELLVAIEDEFGVTIFDDNMAVFGSVNKVADYIVSNTKAAS